MDFRYNFFYNYFQILNISIIRKTEFHLFLSIIDAVIMLIKALNIYHTNYNTKMDQVYKELSPCLFFRDYSIFLRLVPIIIYLLIIYVILVKMIFYGNNKRINKLEIIIINIFELFFIRILFIFFGEFLFYLPTLYFLLFFLLSLPFLIFIFIDMTYFHLGQFMLSSVSFPFDEFTSICDREKLIIKILISISSISRNVYICKFMYFLQFILLICFCCYNTYLILYKSYYMMNNESYDKIRYSNLICLLIIQILVFFIKPEEIFHTSYITIFICIILFISILVFMSYDPYSHIIIDVADNPENLYYYFFLMDRNKNISFYLDDKIKQHIAICNCCSLCLKYQKYYENNNVIEIVKDNEVNEDNNNEKEEEKDKDSNPFNILYSGKDKSMILFNQLINDIKRLGNNCLNYNSYYTIKFTYIYYYSLRYGDITFSLNMILLFNLIQENNQILITSDKISINQIIHINEFLILYKEILTQIKEIISKNTIKRYIDKFFTLSKKLTVINSSKFKENLFMTKMEGTANYSYLLNICSLLYEEIFNKSISSHSIPIRENPQLIEDILKNFVKQSNYIILNFNMKTFECKILSSGMQLIEYINKNFYDLFPNQIKAKLIQNFTNEILYPKEKGPSIQVSRNTKQKLKQAIETSLIIKNNEDNMNYFWVLYLKLFLLFNNIIRENIILNGYFIIHKNTLMTIKSKEEKEKICGFGTKEIMNAAYQKKLSYLKFLESDYMKNKLCKESFSLNLNDNEFLVYNITENKIKKKKNVVKEGLNKQFTTFKEIKLARKSTKKELMHGDENGIKSALTESANPEEDNTNNDNIDNSQKVKNLIEDNASQSSAMTKSSLSSFWNINKPQGRDNQNNFTSKKFFKLQMLLGGFLLLLLILMIILILKIRIKQNEISTDCNNYLDLIQFIRVFQQFSTQFLTIVCVVHSDNSTDQNCSTYISQFDTEEFNQTLFTMRQLEILAELGSESINQLILNSESIHDEELLNLLRGNFSYNLISKKMINNMYNISNTLLNLSLNDALLLTSNNMRIIVSSESRIKGRDKEPIYLLSGYDSPFENIHNLTEDLSDYQISVYTYLMNFRGFVLRFSILNKRFHTLINIRNDELLNLVYIFHNIIFVVMIFQIITILFYLYTYNSVLAEIINSLIAKFDVIFDNENDFKKLYTRKINLLESLVNEKNNNLGNSINDINKNCIKYESLVGLNKKNEQRLNMNKRYEKEEEKPVVFKDNQKYINWFDIYKKGFDRFYIIFTIVICIIDIMVYGVIYGIWLDYESKSKTTLELIDESWSFERYTLRIINFYHHMIFANQTLEEITKDYFTDNNYTCIENFLIILNSYNQLRRKKEASTIFKSYSDYCEYNCDSLYTFMESIDNSWLTTLNEMELNYGKNKAVLKRSFVKQCENVTTFIVDSVTPAFQSFYQKCIDAMILFDSRKYEDLIKQLLDSDLPWVTSIFLNVTRYILYIIGKVSYSGSFDTILGVLGNTIIISLILYVVSECLLFIFFFFVYFWNINIECKNMFVLKKVFEVTNSNDT